jgi:hypothetical protein
LEDLAKLKIITSTMTNKNMKTYILMLIFLSIYLANRLHSLTYEKLNMQCILTEGLFKHINEQNAIKFM